MEHVFGQMCSYRAAECLVANPSRWLEYDFAAMPQVLGWTYNADGHLQRRTDYPQNRPKTRDEVLQIWLFFALLKTIFEPVIPGFSNTLLVEHFCHEGRNHKTYLNTKALRRYLDKWTRYEANEDPSIRRNAIERMTHVYRVLVTARQVVRTSCTARYSDPGARCLLSNVNAETLQCITVLGETLERAATIIRDAARIDDPEWGDTPPAPPGWGYNYHILEKEFWGQMCPKELHHLLGNLNQSTTGLIHALNNRMTNNRVGGDHGACSYMRCELTQGTGQRPSRTVRLGSVDRTNNKLSNDDYTCIHTDSGCACVPEGPNFAALTAMLQRGSIPLAYILQSADASNMPPGSFTDQGSSPVIKLFEWNVNQGKDPPQFVAFSHSWSHGFANPKENKMQTCTIKYLSGLIQKYSKKIRTEVSHERPLYFWIDTFSIPVKDPPDTVKDLRKEAIQQIPHVYKNAYATFALDRDLLGSISHGDLSDDCMKITMCDWMSRLWTLEETVLSQRLFFVFEYKELVSLEEMENEYGQSEADLCDSRKAISRCFYDNLMGQFRRDIGGMHDRIRDLTPSHVVQICSAARSRQTARIEHETLAYAAMMSRIQSERDILPQLLRMEPRGDQTPTLKAVPRMVRFLEHLADGDCRIPAILLFLPGARLKSERFSWAPASFMVPHHYMTYMSASRSTIPICVGPSGFAKITAPGIFLHSRKTSVSEPNPFQREFDFFVTGGHQSGMNFRLQMPFPSDRLTKWRHRSVDHQPPPETVKRGGLIDALAYEEKVFSTLNTTTEKYAVICLELPRKSETCVAILVRIGMGGDKQEHFVTRLGNVLLQRVGDDQLTAELQTNYGNSPDKFPFFGSTRDTNTVWWIKGWKEEPPVELGPQPAADSSEQANSPPVQALDTPAARISRMFSVRRHSSGSGSSRQSQHRSIDYTRSKGRESPKTPALVPIESSETASAQKEPTPKAAKDDDSSSHLLMALARR